MADAKVALVIGAGEATGGAIARRFAREGYTVCATRRNADKLKPLVDRIESEGGQARAFGSDARKEGEVAELVQTIEEDIGPIEVCVFNVGGNVRFPIREMTARVYTKVWEKAGILDPEAIAENYWQLHLQPRSAWTHELDLRPWMEPW